MEYLAITDSVIDMRGIVAARACLTSASVRHRLGLFLRSSASATPNISLTACIPRILRGNVQPPQIAYA